MQRNAQWPLFVPLMVETYEKVGTGASNERFHMLIADRGVANFRVVRAVLLFLCVHARSSCKAVRVAARSRCITCIYHGQASRYVFHGRNTVQKNGEGKRKGESVAGWYCEFKPGEWRRAARRHLGVTVETGFRSSASSTLAPRFLRARNFPLMANRNFLAGEICGFSRLKIISVLSDVDFQRCMQYNLRWYLTCKNVHLTQFA